MKKILLAATITGTVGAGVIMYLYKRMNAARKNDIKNAPGIAAF